VLNRKHPLASVRSETPGTHGNSTRETWETRLKSIVPVAAVRLEMAMNQTSNTLAANVHLPIRVIEAKAHVVFRSLVDDRLRLQP
jgi:hypothetical protein